NRAAYGGERIILVAHGEPKAAIISFDDLQRLRQLQDVETRQHNRYTTALANATLVRDRIREWQTTYQIEPEDSVDTLKTLRKERDDELGLR
ncbi:MAG: type II toxin-antitoxin system prevent-host-death family antitoxin, partial [Anaerolineae bacterium]|nr:type II toxin-antitoxin system prevent-host-death family antitoxin [Anaerolineae bacterium]